MIHRVPYIENLKTEYSELLKSCLGKRIVSARRRFYKFDDDIDVTHRDTSEVVLFFDSASLYFCWVQFDDEFDLSISDKTHLIEGQFSERKAEDDNVLSKVLGKNFTKFELYEDKFGSVFATLLHFENESLVLAIGHNEWNANEQQEEFMNFYGDDFYLWTVDDFKSALQKHRLEVAMHKSYYHVQNCYSTDKPSQKRGFRAQSENGSRTILFETNKKTEKVFQKSFIYETSKEFIRFIVKLLNAKLGEEMIHAGRNQTKSR